MKRLWYFASAIALLVGGCSEGKSGQQIRPNQDQSNQDQSNQNQSKHDEAIRTHDVEQRLLARKERERKLLIEDHDREVSQLKLQAAEFRTAELVKITKAPPSETDALMRSLDERTATVAANTEKAIEQLDAKLKTDLATIDKAIAEQRTRSEAAFETKEKAAAGK